METAALSRRRLLQGGAALGAGLAIGASPLRHLARASHQQPLGLHQTFGADPTTAMNITWGTSTTGTPKILYGIGTDLGEALDVVDTRNHPAVPTRYHHAHLTGLAPGQTYTYVVRDGGTDIGHGTFTTAPATPEVFRFVTFGDMGVSDGAKAILARIVEAQADLAFVVGDLCYADLSGGTGVPLPYNATLWDQWLHQIEGNAASMPWMTTVGNHEMERDGGELGYTPYLSRFSLPGNGPSDTVWSMQYANVAFIALDGNDASYEIAPNLGYLGNAQDEWLEAQLAAFDKAGNFIVIGFHNCMYCSNALHASDGGNRRRWQGLFEKYGVDLVVNGHNHCYERTELIGGVTYLTAGGGGQAEYPTFTWPASYVVEEGGIKVPETALWSAVRHPGHSLAVVDVTSTEMTINGITKAGAAIEAPVTLPAKARPVATSAA